MQGKSLQRIRVVLISVLMLGCGTAMEAEATEQKSVQESLKRLVAQREILELISQYSYTWDGKDPDGLAKLFTKDAVWEWWGPGAKKPGLVHKSRNELRDWAAERFKTNLADRQTRHYQTNTVFLEMTGNLARTRTMIVVTHAVKGEKALKVAVSGTYEDEFRRTPDGWRISHRLLRTDG